MHYVGSAMSRCGAARPFAISSSGTVLPLSRYVCARAPMPVRSHQFMQVHLEDGQLPLEATHIISTLPLPILHSLLPPQHPLPHLLTNPNSTVTVLNLVFAAPPPPRVLHPPGFGYLISRPEEGYDTSIGSGPGLLGVVFDTCSMPEQDDDDDGRFIKMTAMLG